MVHQNIEILCACSGCKTSVERQLIPNRNGPFIVIEKYDDNSWLCAPLYTFKDEKNDRYKLDENKKDGHHSWKEVDSYFSMKQFWIIPSDCLVSASVGVEFSKVGSRNTFAENDPSALSEIAAHSKAEGIEFKPIPN